MRPKAVSQATDSDTQMKVLGSMIAQVQENHIPGGGDSNSPSRVGGKCSEPRELHARWRNINTLAHYKQESAKSYETYNQLIEHNKNIAYI